MKARSRRQNFRLVKIHRSYSVEEAARLCSVHKNTVLLWLKGGLPRIDDRKPILILGRELARFLQRRREVRRRPCGPSEMYCLRCRCPRCPADLRATYEPQTALLGNLRAACGACGGAMNRRTSAAKLGRFLGHLAIALPQGLRHIDQRFDPTLNGELAGGGRHV
jgi:hypothetical protein